MSFAAIQEWVDILPLSPVLKEKLPKRPAIIWLINHFLMDEERLPYCPGQVSLLFHLSLELTVTPYLCVTSDVNKIVEAIMGNLLESPTQLQTWLTLQRNQSKNIESILRPTTLKQKVAGIKSTFKVPNERYDEKHIDLFLELIKSVDEKSRSRLTKFVWRYAHKAVETPHIMMKLPWSEFYEYLENGQIDYLNRMLAAIEYLRRPDRFKKDAFEASCGLGLDQTSLLREFAETLVQEERSLIMHLGSSCFPSLLKKLFLKYPWAKEGLARSALSAAVKSSFGTLGKNSDNFVELQSTTSKPDVSALRPLYEKNGSVALCVGEGIWVFDFSSMTCLKDDETLESIRRVREDRDSYYWQCAIDRLPQKLCASLERSYFKSLARPEISCDDSLVHLQASEAFLKRLSLYPIAKELFVLRGGLLTRQLIKPVKRWAADVDFIALIETPYNNQHILPMLNHILATKMDDEFEFLTDCMSYNNIWVDHPDSGMSFQILAKTPSGIVEIEVDFAFGDPIFPYPIPLTYEMLSGEKIKLQAVSAEQMFAWKLEGVFENLEFDIRGKWRGKDLYDLWLLARFSEMDMEHRLPVTIASASGSRMMSYHIYDHLLNLNLLGKSTASVRLWFSFRKKMGNYSDIPEELEIVVHFLSEFLKPVLSNVCNFYLIGGVH